MGPSYLANQQGELCLPPRPPHPRRCPYACRPARATTVPSRPWLHTGFPPADAEGLTGERTVHRLNVLPEAPGFCVGEGGSPSPASERPGSRAESLILPLEPADGQPAQSRACLGGASGGSSSASRACTRTPGPGARSGLSADFHSGHPPTTAAASGEPLHPLAASGCLASRRGWPPGAHRRNPKSLDAFHKDEGTLLRRNFPALPTRSPGPASAPARPLPSHSGPTPRSEGASL